MTTLTHHSALCERLLWALVAALFLVLLAASPALAQEERPVTADEVNAVASQLYCPVCENIPLDDCGTQACIDWREEIRVQLSEGSTPQQVIDDFIARYGERVVGTPQDPALRALSLLTPWLLALLAFIVAVVTLRSWRRRAGASTLAPAGMPAEPMTDDDYRARIEADIRTRR